VKWWLPRAVLCYAGVEAFAPFVILRTGLWRVSEGIGFVALAATAHPYLKRFVKPS
jgi:hypothetical protein